MDDINTNAIAQHKEVIETAIRELQELSQQIDVIEQAEFSILINLYLKQAKGYAERAQAALVMVAAIAKSEGVEIESFPEVWANPSEQLTDPKNRLVVLDGGCRDE